MADPRDIEAYLAAVAGDPREAYRDLGLDRAREAPPRHIVENPDPSFKGARSFFPYTSHGRGSLVSEPVADARDYLVSKVPEPAMLWAQFAVPGAKGAAAAGKVAKPAISKMEPAPQGKVFDMSKLDQVPDVPQKPLPRYVPPRGVPQRTTDLIDNKGVQKQLSSIIDKGAMMGGARWYNADPLLKSFIDTLGPEQGPAAFRQYMDYVAATSPRSRVDVNIRNASHYYQKARNGEPMPEVGTKNPQPYGHIAQKLHQQNAKNVAETGGWDVMQNPKPASFVENLTGNQLPGTIDAHAVKLPAMLAEDPRWIATSFRDKNKDGSYTNYAPQKMFKSGELTMEGALKRPVFWESMPRQSEYGALEGMYAGIGKKKGHTTGQTQAMGWIAGGDKTGLGSEATPWLKNFEDVLLRTAEKNGESPLLTLKKFIKGEGTLYGGAAAATAAPLAGTVVDDGQRQ